MTGSFPHSHPNSSPSAPEFGYGQLLKILMQRLPWFLATVVISLLAAALYSSIKQPTFESSMQLLVEPNYQARTKTNETTPPSDRENQVDYATQLNLMRSVVFIERALKQLEDEYPDLEVEDVQEKLTLTQLTEDNIGTKIFKISYSDNDPLKVQQVLNAIQNVYQTYNLEQQKQRLEQGLKFIDEQIVVVRGDLSTSQRDLEKFRQNQRLIDPKEEATAAAKSLAEVKQERQKAEAEYQDGSARYSQLQQQLGFSPQTALFASRLSQSTRVQSLLDELQKTELELAKQQITYTGASPTVRKLTEQRQSQVQLLQQEMGRVVQQATPTGETLLQAGQLSNTDVKLIETLLDLRTTLVGLEARRQTLAQLEQTLVAQLQRFPTLIARYDRLEPDVETKREVLQTLLEQRQKVSAELAGGGFNWQIVEPAKLGEFVGPKLWLNLALGGIVGLFLGGVVVFAREANDRSVRSLEAVQNHLGLPLLGSLPNLPRHRGIRCGQSQAIGQLLDQVTRADANKNAPQYAGSDSSAILLAIQSAPCREALDLIYKQIEFLRLKSPLRSLVVTSAVANEGKSLVALGLALSAARAHQRVLLIDANLRQPSLHLPFQLDNLKGLSLALAQGNLPIPLQISWANVQFDLLTAGPVAPDPMRLLSSPRMQELVQRYEAHYDLVLIDTLPLLGSVDALQTASCCEGLVLVSRLNQVMQQDLAQAASLLQPLNGVGVVVNGTGQPAHLSFNPSTAQPAGQPAGWPISQQPVAQQPVAQQHQAADAEVAIPVEVHQLTELPQPNREIHATASSTALNANSHDPKL